MAQCFKAHSVLPGGLSSVLKTQVRQLTPAPWDSNSRASGDFFWPPQVLALYPYPYTGAHIHVTKIKHPVKPIHKKAVIQCQLMVWGF